MEIFHSFSGHQQPPGAPKSIQFTSKYQVLELWVPQHSPGGPRIFSKRRFASIIVSYWNSFGHQQPPGAPKSTQFTSKYEVFELWVPQHSPGGPRIPQKTKMLQLLTDIGARFGIDLCTETCFLLCFLHESFCALCEGIPTDSVSTKWRCRKGQKWIWCGK